MPNKTVAIDADRQFWIDAWTNDEITEHAKEAGRHLYTVGVVAAVGRTVLTYSQASASLEAAGHGFGSPRGIGYALDALAAV